MNIISEFCKLFTGSWFSHIKKISNRDNFKILNDPKSYFKRTFCAHILVVVNYLKNKFCVHFTKWQNHSKSYTTNYSTTHMIYSPWTLWNTCLQDNDKYNKTKPKRLWCRFIKLAIVSNLADYTTTRILFKTCDIVTLTIL